VTVTPFIGSGPTGTQKIRITNPGGGSAEISFQAITDTPTITSINPTSVTVNQATSIFVHGANFQSGFTAQAITSAGTFDISDRTFENTTQVRVGVVMGGTAPYTATLKIINPAGAFANATFQVVQ
jgi:hypothetical protein